MPRKQATTAQKARRRQAATGEKYTAALRARATGPVRHRQFSARGTGWAPIIERAERRLVEVRPGHPAPDRGEKFGDLCWKGTPWPQAPTYGRWGRVRPERHAATRRV